MNTPADLHDIALSFRNVGLVYTSGGSIFGMNKYWALKDVSFDLKRGENLAIVGRNGSGKSTLLRLMAGVFQPDRGEVINPGNYKASLLSLQLGFLPHLTGRQNVIASSILLGISRQYAMEKMEKIRRFADIGDFFDKPVRMYSSGMRARLGFAVAIEADPDILLIDEVLGVGDFDFKKKSSLAIKQRIRSNKTVVIVSHQPSILKELCDRVVWIANGKVEDVGTPDEIVPRYQKEKTGKKRKLRDELVSSEM